MIHTHGLKGRKSLIMHLFMKDELGFKVTVHLEWRFQFSIRNFVITHRTLTTYISMETLNDGEMFV